MLKEINPNLFFRSFSLKDCRVGSCNMLHSCGLQGIIALRRAKRRNMEPGNSNGDPRAYCGWGRLVGVDAVAGLRM